jgi:uncharacterized protein
MSGAPARYPSQAPIDAYGNGGFRFAGMSHRGSLLCLPSGIYAWDPPDPVDARSLERVLAGGEAVGMLLLGTGAAQKLPDAAVRRAFAEAQIALESMDTGAACRTYNILLTEKRSVAAALVAVG